MTGTSEGAKKAAETKGPEGRSEAARKAGETRGHESLSRAGQEGGKHSQSGSHKKEENKK